MNVHLLCQWIRFPMTANERTIARNKFALAPQPFPGAIGAIDCTHVNILALHIHEEAYVNHHGNHSLNVQAIVDPDLKILNINARYPGARNDAYIWSASPIRNVMENLYNNGERRTYLIEFDNFTRFVIWKSTNLEMKFNRFDENQTTVLKKLSMLNIENEKEDKETIDVFDNLPLRDEDGLKRMEIKLRADPCYRNQMMKQLSRLTCENGRTSSIRLMRAILSNEIAVKYSWYGAKKKEIFSQLEICKIIMNIMRKMHTDLTDEQIAIPIRIWLAHAKERIGKEKNMEKEKESTH